MVNTYVIKTKVRLRKGPQHGLWMWCTVIKCLISLPCILSSCQGVNISVAVYPEGRISLPYGQPLELLCVAEVGTADKLEFEFNGNTLPSDQVNSTTRRLYIEKLERQVYSYYCRNNATGKICVSRVIVDSPPANVTDFGCVSKNLEELNCTWSSTDIYALTNYKLSFSINGNTAVEPCKATENRKIRSCLWTTTTNPRYRQVMDKYFFHLTSCNYFGCNNQYFTIDHFSIVKPEAPLNLKVVRNDSHSVLLHWNIPNNMVDFLQCNVVHRIEYQIAKIDNKAHFRSVGTSTLPGHNRTYNFWLSNLPYAHMQYEVRIYIKCALATEEKFWSEYTYVVFYTASERPQRPPDTIAGAFHQALYDDKRVIYVYWIQLEEYEEAGANFTYKVVIAQGSKTPQIVYPDKNKSLSYIILNDASLGALDITIWSTNGIGPSDNSSHLYIPAKQDTEELRVESFTKMAYENGTYKLSWVGIKNIDNYTLFWCAHDITRICAGRMDFVVLDPNKNSHVIHLPTDTKYQFAISANNGSKTSGMIWTSCDVYRDFISTYIPIRSDHDAPANSYENVQFTTSCMIHKNK